MSAGKMIIGGATPSRIGERISSESARRAFPARRASQSHSAQSRSAREVRRAPALKRRNLTPLIVAFMTKAHTPASHKTNDRLKIIGLLVEGLTLTAGDGFWTTGASSFVTTIRGSSTA